MTTQTQLPLYPMIETPHGKMRVSSLRPGDWCRNSKYPRVMFCVLINSEKLARLVVRFAVTGDEKLEHYRLVAIEPAYRYIGSGRRRAWHPLLPKFIRSVICPYSQP